MGTSNVIKVVEWNFDIDELTHTINTYFNKIVEGTLADETKNSFSILEGKKGLIHYNLISVTAKFEILSLDKNHYRISLALTSKTSGSFWINFAFGTFFYPVFWPMLIIQYNSMHPSELYFSIFDACINHIAVLNGQKIVQIKQNEEVLADASQKLENGNRSVLIYQQRVNALIELGKYDEALKDINLAIIQEPDNSENYWIRRKIHYQFKDWENCIKDSIQISRLSKEPSLYIVGNFDDPFSQILAKNVNNHFSEIVHPQIMKNNETLIDFWLAPAIIWGRETRQVMYDGYSHIEEFGYRGCGYICLTEEKLRLITLKQNTDEFEKIIKDDKKRGAIGFLADIFNNTKDQTRPTDHDNYWEVPTKSIMGAQIADDRFVGVPLIRVVSPALTWQLFVADQELVLTGLNMVLAKNTKIETDNANNIASLLRELTTLHNEKVITDEEYEQKKKDLLSRF